MRSTAAVIVACLFGGPLGSVILAAPGDVLAILRNPATVDTPLSAFGSGVVTASGTSVLVGDHWRHLLNENGQIEIPYVGSAYLFDGLSGELRFEIPNPSPRLNNSFGRGVALQAGRLFANKPGSSLFHVDDQGKLVFVRELAQVFAFDQDTSEVLFTVEYPGPRQSGGPFGTNMAPLGDDRVVVAAINDTVGTVPYAGRLYVIDAFTGDIVLEIPHPEPSQSLLASGLGLATRDNRIIAGSFIHDPFQDPDTPKPGAAFVFNGDTGELLFRLDNPSPESIKFPEPGLADWFGFSVEATHDKFIVGAPLEDTAGVRSSGAVYAFDAHDGSLLLTIPNPNPTELAEFGRSIAGVGQDILVGSARVASSGEESTGSGVAYLFDGDTGELLMEIANPGDGWHSFGYVVTNMANDLVISAPAGQVDGARGAVYIIEGLPERIPGDANRDGRVDSTDLTTLLLNWTGALEIGEGGKLFYQGDFNFDRNVDSSDLTILLANWTVAGGSTPPVTVTPEPGGLVMLALALLLMRRHGYLTGDGRRRAALRAA